MFQTFASFGVFLFCVAVPASGMQSAPADSSSPPKTLTVPAGDTQQLSPKGHPYLDPEILSEYGLVTFIDREKPDAPRRIWVGTLDPMTGLFKSGHGRDILIDTGHTDLRFTHNGSEWALDRNGWSVVYTKEVNGVRHMWRGYLDGKKVVAGPVSSGQIPAFGGVGSINPNADSTRIIAISGAWDGGEKVWMDVKDGARRHPIGPTIDHTDGRWIAGTNLLVSVMEEKEDSGQLLLMDTDTGESRRITDDHGRKGRFYGWLAPEAGGKVRVLAVRDKRELVVYEDRGGKFWEAIQTHRPPNNGVGVSSPEPFVVGGRSYATVSVGLRMEPGTRRRETQIWILDLSGEDKLPVRGDDGSSDPGHRTDAEVFVGAEQVFVIHTYHPPGRQVEVRRTATGIRSHPSSKKRYPQRTSADAAPAARGAGKATRTDARKVAASAKAAVPGAVPTPENSKRAADYSAKHGGRAVLVMVAGKTVFERYDNGFGPDTATHLHSATKGFWGPVIAAMIEDGLIGSYDELASKTLPEWKEHARKSRITLRHLLTLSAGLVQDVVNLQGHARPTLAPDLYKHAIGVLAAREPGATFQYGPSCYYVLGEIMKRKLAARKQAPLDYLKQRILDPIGVKVGDWVHDASGNPHIPNGAHLTARNWAKYGQWLLQGGEWNGKQIVAKELLDELVKPSKANPGHGLALWLNQPGGRGAVGVAGQRSDPGDKAGWIYRGDHSNLFAALGAGKCRMYVIPSLEMVALRQGDSKIDRFDDYTFLSLLLTGRSPDSASQRPGGGNQSVDLLLKRMDRNGDGKIAPEETGPQLKRVFDRLDRDGDGTLDATELRPILERRSGNQ